LGRHIDVFAASRRGSAPRLRAVAFAGGWLLVAAYLAHAQGWLLPPADRLFDVFAYNQH
jgi:hypothetical protein